MKKTRIDIYLVEKGFFPSRTKAQDAIKAGSVSLKEGEKIRLITIPSELMDDDRPAEILIQKSSVDRYVSRAGLKLDRALNFLQLNVEDWNVLDVGISTGGFSDCLLQRGASSIVGIDVGHNQLSLKIKANPRVRLFEGVNAREIHKNENVLKTKPAEGFNLVVVDVSFISLTLVLPSVMQLLHAEGLILALVKPQFEVGPEGLGKNGIVKNEKLYGQVQQKIEECVKSLGGMDIRYFESELEGKDGNKEFFIFFKKA
jgi:23S rRNA (cytidine1920-2'-O)/16S rRNA (cytidine1409-2'-O)-methyltransferase